MSNRNNQNLQFNKEIISSIDFHIPLQELIERLSELHDELSNIDQDTINLVSVDKYRKDLLDSKLIANKSNGVQAFTACCLSDILRIYAPDAPYTDTELAEIFKLFFRQLKYLSDPENGYFLQQVYLLTKLVEVRSIVLITDLPKSASLISKLFQVFYDPQSNQIPISKLSLVGDLLGEVVSEADVLSMDVLKLIFNKFLTYDLNSVPRGLNVAHDSCFQFTLHICEKYSNRMGRHLTKFYSEILYGLTSTNKSNKNSNHDHGEEEEENKEDGIVNITSVNDESYKTLTNLHTLVLKLWLYVPELLSSINGFIFQELNSLNYFVRISATKLVGDILGTQQPNMNYVTAYNETYKAWLTKVADSNSKVRISWVKTVAKIFNNSQNDIISNDICNGVCKTLMDVDIRVRLAAVQIFDKISVEIIWLYMKTSLVFQELFHFTRDKNQDIRETVLAFLSSFYQTTMTKHYNVSINNQELVEITNKIPTVLLNLYYINDKTINQIVDKYLLEKIIPYNEESAKKRVDRLLLVTSHLDKKALASFYAFNRRQIELSLVVTKFVEFSELANGLANDENVPVVEEEDVSNGLNQIIKWLSDSLSNSFSTQDILKLFVSMKNKRLYCLLKTIVSSDSPYHTILSCLVEFNNKLKDARIFDKVKLGSTFTRADFAQTFKLLAYRSAPIYYNISNVEELLKRSDSKHLIDNITEVNPSLFKDQIETLQNAIKQYGLDEKATTKDAVDTLRTIYRIGKAHRHYLETKDTFFIDRLKDFSISGLPYEAKYATKVLGLLDGSEKILQGILDSILPLKKSGGAALILTVSEIYKLRPELLKENTTDIVTFVLSNILLTNEITSDDENDTWIADEFLNKTENNVIASKVFSLELLKNSLVAISNDLSTDQIIKEAFINKTLKLFIFLVATGGELINESNKEFYPTPVEFQRKLRCVAGIQLLKLAKVHELNKFISSESVEKLVNLMEDESLQVRETFITYLKKYISEEKISIKFLPLVFFVAFEPDKTLKHDTRIWIQFMCRKEIFKRNTFFERGFPRLIHYIAHHPDVSDGLDEGNERIVKLKNALEYLVFFFDNILTKENISLLYYLAGRIKQYTDKVQENKEYIYIISELCQLVLLEIKSLKNWDIPVYSGKLNLPSDLFSPIEDPDKRQEISFKCYLKNDNLEQIIRHKLNQMGFGKLKAKLLTAEKLKPVSKSASKATRKYKKKRNVIVDDDDVGDDRYVKKLKPEYPIRKSARPKKDVNYKDSDDDDDDDEE